MNASHKTRPSAARRRGAPPAGERLSRQAVVEAARDLISEHGYGGFSLRTLAGTLGVRPAALYNHVRDRDDLLDAVAEQFVGTFELPGGDGEWPHWVGQVARGLRTHMRTHPHLTAVVLGRASAGPARPALLRRFMARLAGAGVDPATAHAGWHALLHVVVGAVSLEDARERVPDDRMPDDNDFETTLELLIEGLLAAASRPAGERSVALLRAHRGALEDPA